MSRDWRAVGRALTPSIQAARAVGIPAWKAWVAVGVSSALTLALAVALVWWLA